MTLIVIFHSEPRCGSGRSFRGRAAEAEEDGGVEAVATEEEEIGLCAKFSLMLS
jgi:hypothetical protein